MSCRLHATLRPEIVRIQPLLQPGMHCFLCRRSTGAVVALWESVASVAAALQAAGPPWLARYTPSLVCIAADLGRSAHGLGDIHLGMAPLLTSAVRQLLVGPTSPAGPSSRRLASRACAWPGTCPSAASLGSGCWFQMTCFGSAPTQAGAILCRRCAGGGGCKPARRRLCAVGSSAQTAGSGQPLAQVGPPEGSPWEEGGPACTRTSSWTCAACWCSSCPSLSIHCIHALPPAPPPPWPLQPGMGTGGGGLTG